MKIGNKVKVYNVSGKGYDIVTLVGLTKEAASVSYKDLPGIFTFKRSLVRPLGNR